MLKLSLITGSSITRCRPDCKKPLKPGSDLQQRRPFNRCFGKHRYKKKMLRAILVSKIELAFFIHLFLSRWWQLESRERPKIMLKLNKWRKRKLKLKSLVSILLDWSNFHIKLLIKHMKIHHIDYLSCMDWFHTKQNKRWRDRFHLWWLMSTKRINRSTYNIKLSILL